MKIYALLALALLIGVAGANAETVFNDTFTRSDGPLGQADSGQNWTGGGWGIVSNVAQSSNSTSAQVNFNVLNQTNSANVNITFQIRATVVTTDKEIYFRNSTGSTTAFGIRIITSSNVLQLRSSNSTTIFSGVVLGNTFNVSFYNINFTARTFSANVVRNGSGSGTLTGYSFGDGAPVAVNHIDQVLLLGAGTSGTGELDNILINANLTSSATPTNNISIIAVNNYTLASISTFNASVQWNGSTVNYTTTTSQINTTASVNSTLPANITISASGLYFIYTTTGYTTTTLNSSVVPWANITARDRYDASTINNFSAVVNGTTYSTTTGSVQVPTQGLYNATITATNYFNGSLTNVASNATQNGTLFQAQVSFNSTEIISLLGVTSFTTTAPNGINTNTTAPIYLKAGVYNFTWNKTGWFSKTQQITITALQNDTQTITGVYQFLFNISAQNLVTNFNETTFTISATSGIYAYNINTSTTNGSAQFPWTNDTNINLSISGAATIAASSVLYNTSNFTNASNFPLRINYRFLGFTTNSFFIRFADEETGSTITGINITAFFTGTVISYNYTTSTGFLNATLLNPQNYTITYGGGGYTERVYVVQLENQTYQSLTLYLLLNSTGTYIRFTVLDQTYQTLNNAVINAQKKNLSGTNYYAVADCTTDSNGECLIFLETLTTTYRFLTEYASISRYSSDTVLSRDTYTIVLNTGSSTLQDVLDRSGVRADLNYTPVGSFYYTVDDDSNNVQNALLVIERRYGGRWTELNRTTGSGSSLTLSLTGINVTLGDEVRASGYLVVDGNNVLTHQRSVVYSRAGSALGGAGGLAFFFLGMAFTIIFIFAWNPVAPLIAFAAFVIISSWVGIISIGSPAVIGIIIIIVIAIYRMRSV